MYLPTSRSYQYAHHFTPSLIPPRLNAAERLRSTKHNTRRTLQTAATASEATAKDAVESGLAEFGKGREEAALQLFLRWLYKCLQGQAPPNCTLPVSLVGHSRGKPMEEEFSRARIAEIQFVSRALGLKPSREEARAALYNAACAHTRLKQWQPAADAVARAVNEYDLPLRVAMEDRDLRQLRERREWQDAVEGMQGGLTRGNLINVRAEARSPFRLVRLLVLGGLSTGALVGLLIILGRLLSSAKGGEGAPELSETLVNVGINSAALAVLGFFLLRDLRGQQSDRKIVEREESLARLQVRIGGERVVTLSTIRGSVRPVLISGSRSQVQRSVKAAGPYIDALRDRGISVIPLPTSGDEPGDRLAALKAEFRPKDSTPATSTKGFGKAEEAPAAKPKSSSSGAAAPKGRRFEIQPYRPEEWLEWLAALKEEAGVSSDQIYVQIQLDGTVRSSGKGAPNWAKLCEDLPPLDSLRTKMTDGIRK